MKLSLLYTEHTNLSEGLSDKIKELWAKKKSPAQIAVDQAFDRTIGSKPILSLDDKDRRSIQDKLLAYKATLVMALGRRRGLGLPQMANEMMAKRAARYIHQFRKLQKDPDAIYKSLGLERDWMEHGEGTP